MDYALNHWQALVRYCSDGALAIDNGAAKRALRGITLGRRNWLFCGSERGAQAALDADADEDLFVFEVLSSVLGDPSNGMFAIENRDGAFGSVTRFEAGSAVASAALLDLNRDNLMELAVTSRASNEVFVHRNAALQYVESEFVLRLDKPISQEATVAFTTNRASALPWLDYQPSNGRVIFPAGETEARIPIRLFNDSQDEPAESLVLSLSQPYNARLPVGVASMSVRDDDAILRLQFSATQLSENGGSAVGTVTRSDVGRLDQSLIVTVNATNAAAVGVSSSVTIPAGETSVEFAVTAIDDDQPNGVREITFVVSAPGFQVGKASLEVEDDESAFPWQNATLRYDVNGDGVVSPIDVLVVINWLNRGNASVLLAPTVDSRPPPFIDRNGDNRVTPIDALVIINWLNDRALLAEGEFESCLWTRKEVAAVLLERWS